MPMLARLSSWWKARRPKPLDQLLSVELDEDGGSHVGISRLRAGVHVEHSVFTNNTVTSW